MPVTKTTSHDPTVNYVRALLWGKSGVGKTTSILTLPEAMAVVISAERGLLPLRKHKYETWKIETFDDMREAYMLAIKLGKEKPIVVLDSLTAVSELAKEYIVKTRRPQLLKSQDKKLSGIYDEMMNQQDWGLYDRLIRNLLSAWVQLPRHVIFLAGESWTKSEGTGELVRTPALNGKIAQHCAAYFDLVLWMRAEDTDEQPHRVWQTYANGEVIAKDASGSLGQIEEPDWTKIFKKIAGK